MKILTVQSLFKYHCISEIYKIIKLCCPYPLFECINVSKRDTSMTIILPKKTNTFLYQASILWNTIHKKIIDTSKGLEASVDIVKLRSKNAILDCQAVGEKNLWTDKNFQLFLEARDIDTNSVPHQNTLPHPNTHQNTRQVIDILNWPTIYLTS